MKNTENLFRDNEKKVIILMNKKLDFNVYLFKISSLFSFYYYRYILLSSKFCLINKFSILISDFFIWKLLFSNFWTIVF